MARNQTWREVVFKRDDYCCQCCNPLVPKLLSKLEAHHLESYETSQELRNKVSNGVTLCKFHHNEFHRRYGKDRNTKQQFREYKKDCLSG